MVATSLAVAVPSTETMPLALLEPWKITPAGGFPLSGRAKMPGFAGTIETATGVVVTTLPSIATDRTYALMLEVSCTSHGIWALIWVGETMYSGERMPLKYTCVQTSAVGSTGWVGSALAVKEERSVPVIATIVPGATFAASPPPLRVVPEALAKTWDPVDVVTERVTLFPSASGALARNKIRLLAPSAV